MESLPNTCSGCTQKIRARILIKGGNRSGREEWRSCKFTKNIDKSWTISLPYGRNIETIPDRC